MNQNYIETILNKLKKDTLKEVEWLNCKIREFPAGNIRYVQNGNYNKWYICNGGSSQYVPKKKSAEIAIFAAKKYYVEKQAEFLRRNKLIEQCLEQQHNIVSVDDIFLASNSIYKELLCKYLGNSHAFGDQPDEQAAILLDGACNCTNDNDVPHPETLKHNTLAGHCVRSKSEVMIANALFTKHVKYIYEKPIQCDGYTLRPDFTILHPTEKEIYYWEHFGLMDDEKYREKATKKIISYSEKNIIPGINLIITSETAITPLDSKKIDIIINNTFF